MIRRLRQPLTRIGYLQAFESGPKVEEPCPAEMADCDHVYHDNVTGAMHPSKLCEEAVQLELKFMKEMNVYTFCEHGDVKEQGLTPTGTRLCEEAMQLELEFMKEMNVYTLCEHGDVKEQGLTPTGTRWVFTNMGDTEHPLIRARLVAQETKRTTKMDLTDMSLTFAATPPVG